MNEKPDEDTIRAKALMHGLEYVPLRLIDTGRHLADLLPELVARECHVLPQLASARELRLLMSDPLDFETIDRVRFHCGRKVHVALASHRAIEESIDRVYGTSER